MRLRVRAATLLAGFLLAQTASAAVSRMDPEPGEVPGEEKSTNSESKPLTDLSRARPLVIQAGPVDPASYILGPGDVLELDLWGRLSSSVMLEVSPEGTVYLPGRGTLDVAGKTLATSRERILRMVADVFRGVRADVRLVRLRTFKVYVSGAVREPGAVQVTSAARASEVISIAGIAEGGSRRDIHVRRRDGTIAVVDLERFETLGRQEANPTMVDGDVVVVPRAREFVDLIGAVSRPGRFERVQGDSLRTLVALAGGLLPAAALDSTLMIRFRSATERETLWVDLERESSNPPMRDGDRLFVQFQAGFHALTAAGIFGEVNHPGTYPLDLGHHRVSDLVQWAGGFRPFANRTALLLLRETGTQTGHDSEFDRLVRLSRSEMTESEYARFQTMLSERKNSFRIDWARIQREGPDVDPLLQNGDVVRVDQLVSSVRVEGEVRRPGFVDYVAGRPLSEYIRLSGGFTDRASKNRVRISRSETGQVIPAKSLKGVQAGDFIWVPERRDVDAWAVFRDAVTVLGQVAVIIFTLSR